MKRLIIFLLLGLIFFPSFGDGTDTNISEQYSAPDTDFSYEISEMKYDYKLTHDEKTGRYGSIGTFSFRIKAQGVDYLLVQRSIPYSTTIPFHFISKRGFYEPLPDGTYDVIYSSDEIKYGVCFQVAYFVSGTDYEHTPLSDIYCCNDFISDEHLDLIKESYSSSVCRVINTAKPFEISDGIIILGDHASNINSVILYSTTGSIVFQIENQPFESGQEIPLQQYDKGLYILQVNFDKHSINQKIML